MKKILKTFLVICACLGFINSVEAEGYRIEKADGESSIGGSCKNCYYDKSINSAVNSFVTVPYKVNYKNGTYAAYCLDPLLNDLATVNLKAAITSDTNNKYHAGLFAIATHEDAYFNNNFVSINNDYVITNLALRMWKIATGNAKNSNNSQAQAYVRAIGKTAASIMADNATLAKKATGFDCKTASCFYTKMGIGGSYSSASALYGDVANNIVPGANELFIAALRGASNINDEGTGTSVSSNASKSTAVPTSKDNTSTHFIQKDYFDINVNNFKSKNFVKDIKLECTNCNRISANPTVTLTRYSLDKGATWQTGAPTNAILKSVTGTSKIIIEVTTKIARNAGYKCEDVEVKLSYKYYAPKYDKTVLLLEPTKNANNSQDFVAIVPNVSDEANYVPVEKRFDIDVCGDDYCEYYTPEEIEDMTDEEFEDYTEECCTDLETYCEDESNPAHEQYCDLYSDYCGACDTEIIVPSVCTYIDGADGEAIAEDMTGYIKSAIDEDGNENIKACLLRRKKDEAGHSYKALDNSYCEVYCKEDFGFDLPTAVSINSGTYFQLDATISGTKTCYTSEIDVDKFKSDISGLDVNSEAYKEKVNEYNACVNMEVDYSCFDPTIEFKYDEYDEANKVYNNQLVGDKNKFAQNGDFVETNKQTTYCNSDINNNYSCQGAASTTPTTITVNGKTFNYAKYVKSTITKTGNYKTPSVFYNVRPTGEITTDGSVANSVLIDGMPVSIKTEKGRHKFTLSLKNIGEYYDKSECEAGRLIGDTNSVFNKQNVGKYVAEYQCFYDVNCPECEVECEGPLCDIERCDGPECESTCIGYGCAYDNGLSYAYRTVSLNNLNTSSRKLGFNWDTDKSVKAKTTIEEIELKGEEAYKEAEYSITLTPALISAIKAYNKQELNNGGYANDTLVCSDDKYGNKKVNCESEFIADLVSGVIGSSSNQITVPADDEKFTSWLDSDYCNGTCTITKGSGIGPSWK